jgi:hypothetical protein
VFVPIGSLRFMKASPGGVWLGTRLPDLPWVRLASLLVRAIVTELSRARVEL